MNEFYSQDLQYMRENLNFLKFQSQYPNEWKNNILTENKYPKNTNTHLELLKFTLKKQNIFDYCIVMDKKLFYQENNVVLATTKENVWLVYSCQHNNYTIYGIFITHIEAIKLFEIYKNYSPEEAYEKIKNEPTLIKTEKNAFYHDDEYAVVLMPNDSWVVYYCERGAYYFYGYFPKLQDANVFRWYNTLLPYRREYWKIIDEFKRETGLDFI